MENYCSDERFDDTETEDYGAYILPKIPMIIVFFIIFTLSPKGLKNGP